VACFWHSSAVSFADSVVDSILTQSVAALDCSQHLGSSIASNHGSSMPVTSVMQHQTKSDLTFGQRSWAGGLLSGGIEELQLFLDDGAATAAALGCDKAVVADAFFDLIGDIPETRLSAAA
jgi:hypothetical protein